MAEIRFSTREPFAMSLLTKLDTTDAQVVNLDGDDIVVMFSCTEDEIMDRIEAAEQILYDAGIAPEGIPLPYGSVAC